MEEKPTERVNRQPNAPSTSGLTFQIEEAFTVYPPTSSAWWFLGSLRPTVATGFNVQEVPVAGRDVRLEVFHDRIAVWSKPGADAIQVLGEARELFGVVVGAYSLISGIALDWSLDNWIEAREARLAGTILGVVPDTRGFAAPMGSPRARRSIDMRRAARLAVAVRRKPGWRLALRDIHAALDTPDDDRFVFAYRAVEDVVRAVSKRSGELGPTHWRELHNHLGTSEAAFKDRIDPLRSARRAVAHGDELDIQLQDVRDSDLDLVDLSRRIVAEALDADSSIPFKLAYFRR